MPSNVFRPCKKSSEEELCRCKRGFIECELKAIESRGSCRICIDKAAKHLQKSKCILGSESEFGPVSDPGSVGKDSIIFSPAISDSFVFGENPKGADAVNFPESEDTVVPSDKEESTEINNDTISSQEDDSERVKIEEKKGSMNISLVAGSGGLLLIVIITSLIVLKRRRRRSDDNVQRRENSDWYFDIAPSRNKKGDSAKSTHSTVTRTVFD